MMYRLMRMKPSSFSRLIAATSKRLLCDDQIGKSKHNLEAKLLSLERDLEEIKSKLPIPGKTYGDGANPTNDFNTGLALTKLSLANGRYYIRSEAPWKGYLQGKLCSISEDATKKSQSAMFDMTTEVTDNGSAGFVTFCSPFIDGSYLAVQKIEKDETDGTTVEEEENYSGRLFLLKNDNKSSILEAAQFELFVPLSADNEAKKGDGVRAIIRSVSNQRFLSIKFGGNPFASEKDPALATVFILESKISTRISKMAVPPPGIYYIRAGYSNHGSLIEDETSDQLLLSEEPSRKGLFRLSHNDDGTISLFSLTLSKYVRSNPGSYPSRVGFHDGGEIAKFELHKPEHPSNGAVKLLIGAKCLSLYGNTFSLYDEEVLADLFKFLPVKEGNANVRKD